MFFLRPHYFVLSPLFLPSEEISFSTPEVFPAETPFLFFFFPVSFPPYPIRLFLHGEEFPPHLFSSFSDSLPVPRPRGIYRPHWRLLPPFFFASSCPDFFADLFLLPRSAAPTPPLVKLSRVFSFGTRRFYLPPPRGKPSAPPFLSPGQWNGPFANHFFFQRLKLRTIPEISLSRVFFMDGSLKTVFFPCRTFFRRDYSPFSSPSKKDGVFGVTNPFLTEGRRHFSPSFFFFFSRKVKCSHSFKNMSSRGNRRFLFPPRRRKSFFWFEGRSPL